MPNLEQQKINKIPTAYWSYQVYYVPGILSESEEANLGLQGYARPSFVEENTASAADSPKPGHILIKEVGPIKNQIVDDYGKIVAGCIIGNSTFNGGIKYAEVGIGETAWGAGPGTTAEAGLTGLETPLSRYVPYSMTFLDGSDSPTTTPTNKVRISFLLDSIDAAVDGHDLREFGLFGGAATATLGSGTLFCIFRPLTEYKCEYFRIIYKIDIEFADPT